MFLSFRMSWQKSGSGRTSADDVLKLSSNSSVPHQNLPIEEDAQSDWKTNEDKAKSEQEADVPRNTLEPVARDEALSIPINPWPGRISLQDTAKADIPPNIESTSHRAADPARPCDIEQLEQRYVDLQTQVACLYCLWISDLSPETRRKLLQEAIETARAHVELARETVISAEQRSEHWIRK